MPNQVRVEVARERNHVLRELAARKRREFQQQFLGKTVSAITLTVRENGRTEGLSDNYQKVWITGAGSASPVVSTRM